MTRLPADYEKVYAGMLEEVHGAFPEWELTAFWPQVSEDFVVGTDWLFVGQAVYGWGPGPSSPYSPAFGGRRAPDIARVRAFSEEPEEGDTCPLAWTERQPGRASPFWSMVRWLNVDDDATWKRGWSRRMAWSNLYKVAPVGRGNPDSLLREKQREKCRWLIEREVEVLKPGAVVVLAGPEWYGDFGWVEESLLRRAEKDPFRRVLPARIAGVRAALAPHPNSAFHHRCGVEALGKRVMDALKAGS